jgi:FixJ family two-component response regulator
MSFRFWFEKAPYAYVRLWWRSAAGAQGKVVPNAPIIAIIDDDESVRLATKSLVMSLGLVGKTFQSAEEFLASNSLAEARCLVADVQLSGMSGIELQHSLISRGCRTPIIFITAFANESLRMKALSAGAAGFLVKPFDGNALVECLETALRRTE